MASTDYNGILNKSVCISKEQLQQFVNGTLFEDEQHVVAAHIAGCPLCYYAVKGYLKDKNYAAAINRIVPPELPNLKPVQRAKAPEDEKQYPEKEAAQRYIIPQVKRMMPSANGAHNTLKSLGIAVSILIIAGIVWYFKIYKHSMGEFLGNLNQTSETHRAINVDSLVASDAGTDTPAPKPVVKPRPKPVVQTSIKDTAVTQTAPEDTVAGKTREQSDDALYEKGIAAYHSGDYYEALQHFGPLVSDKSSPRHYDAIYFSGFCYRYEKNYKKAIAMFTILINHRAAHAQEAQELVDLLKEKLNTSTSDSSKKTAPSAGNKKSGSTNTPKN